MKTVDMIASGYEWTCPICKILNREIETMEKVSCAGCGNDYIVNEVEHAIG